ncbi:NYN domain-containing protein [Zafaria sp. J156]|nr:NYN domain-containing protein [Zafaria sp. J156]MEE1621703.1 NYN domain-containing protein [Zafaria sp. J156]
MTTQSAIFVDAGFLLAIGGQQIAGTSLRAATRVNYERLIAGIAACAQEHSGLDNLRIYWYDASRDGLFTDHHKRIGMIDGVKVRLGRISYSGEQKGVDLRLALDLVGLARNGSVSVVYLVSGDDDLAEAVEEAQNHGVKVVLIGLRKKESTIGLASVAEHLALCVDGVTRGRRPGSSAPASGHPAAARSGGPQIVYSSGQQPPTHHPGQPDPVDHSLLEAAGEVGAAVARSWYANAVQSELVELKADRPLLPPEIDRVLLKDCAQRLGEWKTDIQVVRRTVREAFWEQLDELG